MPTSVMAVSNTIGPVPSDAGAVLQTGAGRSTGPSKGSYAEIQALAENDAETKTDKMAAADASDDSAPRVDETDGATETPVEASSVGKEGAGEGETETTGRATEQESDSTDVSVEPAVPDRVAESVPAETQTIAADVSAGLAGEDQSRETTLAENSNTAQQELNGAGESADKTQVIANTEGTSTAMQTQAVGRVAEVKAAGSAPVQTTVPENQPAGNLQTGGEGAEVTQAGAARQKVETAVPASDGAYGSTAEGKQADVAVKVPANASNQGQPAANAEVGTQPGRNVLDGGQGTSQSTESVGEPAQKAAVPAQAVAFEEEASTTRSGQAGAEKGGVSRPAPEVETSDARNPGADSRQAESRQSSDGANDGVQLGDATANAVAQAGAKQAGQTEASEGPHLETQAVDVMGSDSSANGAHSVAAKAPVPETGQEAPVKNEPSVSEQIFDSLRASVARGDKEVSVRLNPPELGSVVIRLQDEHGQVRGTLEVGKADTRYEIEDALPQVVRGLQDAGVQVKRLEVVVNDQPERDLAKEQSQQDSWSEQQNSDSYEEQSQGSAGAAWATDVGDPSAPAEYTAGSASLVGDPADHIDMLV